MKSTTFHFAPTEPHGAMTIAVTVGLGPPGPDLLELPDWVVTAACEGVLEASAMLELPEVLSLIDVQLDDDATESGVEAAAFMATATFAGQAALFEPRLVPARRRGMIWIVRDDRPYPGPDAPAAWIRHPWRSDDDPVRWSAMLYHHKIPADDRRDRYRSASGVLWEVTGIFSGSPIYWRFPGSAHVTLSPSDPAAELRENEILLLIDEPG